MEMDGGRLMGGEMMYYAKQIDENGEIIALHTMSVPFGESETFVPITEAEYLELMANIPEPEPEPTDQISDSEALAIIAGGAAV